MLQQTQVKTVVPYFLRWMERFPDPAAVAAAGERDIMLAWEGLGYYTRAKNIHRTAQVLVHNFGGRIPADFERVARACPESVATLPEQSRALHLTLIFLPWMQTLRAFCDVFSTG